MEEINNRIKKEICYDTLNLLSDIELLSEYKKSNSVKNRINELCEILDKYIDINSRNKIIIEYLPKIIPPGVKGIIRGNKFNNIVKNHIININLDLEKFEICFEKFHTDHLTDEKPDWYILEKETNKILIGMNQLDLWSGGQQSNRGYKYLIDNKHNTKNSKLLCVVCNKTVIKSKKNKIYKLLKIGFENNTLCYLNNLKNIIINYFS